MPYIHVAIFVKLFPSANSYLCFIINVLMQNMMVLRPVFVCRSLQMSDSNGKQLDLRKRILPDATGLHSHSRVYHLKAISLLLSIISFSCCHLLFFFPFRLSITSSSSFSLSPLSQPCTPSPLSPSLMRHNGGKAYAQLAVEAWQKGTRPYQFPVFSSQHNTSMPKTPDKHFNFCVCYFENPSIRAD